MCKKELLNRFFEKTKNNFKPFHIAGDLNFHILNHDKFNEVHNFLNLLYENDKIPTLSKPTRVTRKAGKAVNHILTNQFIDVNFKTKVFKTDILHHFPVCIVKSSKEKLVKNKCTYIYKIVITDDVTKCFNQALYESGWVEIEICDNPSG